MEELDKRSVAIIVISFASPDRLVPYQRIQQWPFVVLADPERSAYGLFSLKRLPWYRLFSFSTIKLYLHLLRQGRKLQNYGKDDYSQGGGDFLLDRRGRLLFAHRSDDPADRPSVNKLLDEIDRVKKQAPV